MSDNASEAVNRFVVVVAAMLVMFAALVVVLLAWGAWGDVAGRIEDFGGWLSDQDDTDSKLIVTLFSAVIVLLMLTAIIVELTPSPLQKMRLRTLKSGDASISTFEAAARIEQEVRSIEHVADCQAIVAASGKQIDLMLDLHVDAGAELATTADEACRRAQELVEQKMGLGLASRPRARMHYRELRLRPERDTRTENVVDTTGWERPNDEELHERTTTDTAEEAQA